MPRPRRVLAYARVSSEEQARGSSLRDQEAAIAAYAASRGLTVAKFYREAESSHAEKFERREQIQALMADVKEGDLVLCDKIDRWSRDPEFSYRSIREILAAKAHFFAVGDSCDPSTPEGDTMLNFRVMFAREEHKRIKQRMVGTRQILRDQGYYVEGLPPLGYLRQHPKGFKGAIKNVLVVDEKGAAIVRKIFELGIAGKSLNEIAAKLNIKRDMAGQVTHNRLYTGEMRNSRGEWIQGKHPAIVDADVFVRAGKALEKRRLGEGRGSTSDARTSSWILRDVARCGLCSKKMSASYGASSVYYRCTCTKAYVNVAHVETAFVPMMLERLEGLREELAAGPEPKKTKAAVIDYDAQRAKLQRRRERYFEAYSNEGMTQVELRLAIAKLDAERLKIDAEEQRTGKVVAAVSDVVHRREMWRSVGELRTAWKRATPEIRKQIVNQLVVGVALVAKAEPVPTWRSVTDLLSERSS